eukprot:scaffold500786_cov35-Prasinocladus_malaysianus.AAC.1
MTDISFARAIVRSLIVSIMVDAAEVWVTWIGGRRELLPGRCTNLEEVLHHFASVAKMPVAKLFIVLLIGLLVDQIRLAAVGGTLLYTTRKRCKHLTL